MPVRGSPDPGYHWPVPRNRTARTAVLGVERPATRGRQVLDTNHRRHQAAARRGRPRAALARARHHLLPRGRQRAARECPERAARPCCGRSRSPPTASPQPFRDAYGWSSSLVDARSDAARLEKENELLRQQVAERQLAQRENVTLREAARVPQRAALPGGLLRARRRGDLAPGGRLRAGDRDRRGREDGVRTDDPVVTQDGLVGKVSRVTHARRAVTLLTDDASAASALDVETQAFGIVRSGDGARAPLRLDRVPKEAQVRGRRHDRHVGLELAAPLVALPARDPDRPRHERRPHRHRSVHAGAGRRRSPT